MHSRRKIVILRYLPIFDDFRQETRLEICVESVCTMPASPSDTARERCIACFSRKGEIKKPRANVEKNRYVQISFMCVHRVIFNTRVRSIFCAHILNLEWPRNKLRVMHQIYR